MVEIKKKRGRPAKVTVEKKTDTRDWVELLRTREPSFDEKLGKLTVRITKLERILEDAVNAGRELHKKMESLSKIRTLGWQAHTAGECPVHDDTSVEVLLRSGEKNGPHLACNFLWRECGTGTIVAYKVL